VSRSRFEASSAEQPSIRFRLVHGGRDVMEVHAAASPLQRLPPCRQVRQAALMAPRAGPAPTRVALLMTEFSGQVRLLRTPRSRFARRVGQQLDGLKGSRVQVQLTGRGLRERPA